MITWRADGTTGTTEIGPAPNSIGETFLIVLSGVPKRECVSLSLLSSDTFKVYAGTFAPSNSPSSEAQAAALCATGTMWFVAK